MVATSVSSLREPRAEFFLVVGGRRPRFLLRLAVIVGGQLLDAGAEYLRQQRHVGRQHRPHGELFPGRALIEAHHIVAFP